MGSDLITICVAINKRKKPNFEKGAQFITRLKKTAASKWPADYKDRWPFEVYGPAEAADLLASDLKELKDRMSSGIYRDVNVFLIDRKRVVLTGGFSGGDSPCDFYDSLDRLITAGVTFACGFDW